MSAARSMAGPSDVFDAFEALSDDDTVLLHRSHLRGPVNRLLRQSKSPPESVDALFALTGRYLDCCTDLEYFLGYTEYLGEQVDQVDLAAIEAKLDVLRARLLEFERSETIQQEARVRARRQVSPRSTDDALVTVGIVVNPLRFRGPQDRAATLLVRGFSGVTDVAGSLLFVAPLWFARWLEMVEHNSTWLRVAGCFDAVDEVAVLETANALWGPDFFEESNSSMSAEDAVAAARRLV